MRLVVAELEEGLRDVNGQQHEGEEGASDVGAAVDPVPGVRSHDDAADEHAHRDDDEVDEKLQKKEKRRLPSGYFITSRSPEVPKVPGSSPSVTADGARR